MTLIRNPAPEATVPKRRRGLVPKALAAIFALVIVWAVAGVFLYVYPSIDKTEQADVLFVLGPPDQRIGDAEQLMQQGNAPMLAVSSPVGRDGKFEAAICGAHRPYRIICFNPDPFTTQGEARALKDLSVKYGWKKANVLTVQFHVTRARVIVSRCFDGEVRMVSDHRDLPLISLTDPVGSWVYQYVYQTAAFVKAAIHPGC